MTSDDATTRPMSKKSTDRFLPHDATTVHDERTTEIKVREDHQKFYDARTDVDDRQRGIYVTDERMAFIGAAVEQRPRPLMMACAERRAKSATERTNTRTTEPTDEFKRFPMRIIIPRDAENSANINTSAAKNARSA